MATSTTTSTFGPDVRAQLDAALEHLNEQHADSVLLVARHLEPAAVDAELAGVDPAGCDLAVRLADGRASTVRLAFPSTAHEARVVQVRLLDALAAARRAAPPSVPLTSLEAELRATEGLSTVHGRVLASRRLTPTVLEVTLAGFDGYPLRGGDEFVYALVARDGGALPPGYSMDEYREQGTDGPVIGAYYTVRRSRPAAGEIDLWVVLHEHEPSVAAWFAAATPGSPLALWGPRPGFALPAGARSLLLVADETGYAAVAALLDAAPPSVEAHAVLEVVDDAHRPPLPERPNLRVTWVHRGAEPPGTTDRLAAALVTAVSSRPDAAFGAGESRRISAVRRHLRQGLGLAAAQVLCTGYWRRAE